MPRKHGTQIVVSVMVTPEQRAAVRLAFSRDKVRTKAEKSMSALAREHFAEYCASQGVEWPQDENEWGGGKRPPKVAGSKDKSLDKSRDLNDNVSIDQIHKHGATQWKSR